MRHLFLLFLLVLAPLAPLHSAQEPPDAGDIAEIRSAAEQGHADANKNREAVAAKLDAASLAEAQKLSKEYFKRYVEPFQ